MPAHWTGHGVPQRHTHQGGQPGMAKPGRNTTVTGGRAWHARAACEPEMDSRIGAATYPRGGTLRMVAYRFESCEAQGVPPG